MTAPRVAPLPFRLGGFGALVVDPPWHFDDQGGRMRLGYSTMTDAEILALPVDTLAPPGRDSHLYLWTTDAHLELALACMRRWGYGFRRTIVWVKTTQAPEDLRRQATTAADDITAAVLAGEFPRAARAAVKTLRFLAKTIGQLRIVGGHYVRGAHELCLFGTRGLTGLERDVPSVFFAPHPKDERGRIVHSAKPDRLYEIAERISPGPRIELFARRRRAGWEAWGNQAPEALEATG